LVKVTFQPSEELIIHESINHSLPDLIKLCSVGLQPGGLGGPLNWAEGVVFRFSRALATDEVFRELLKGKVHWIDLEWALMPQYEQVIPIEEINAKIPVIDVSTTAILCDVAKALKEQAQQETKSASRISWEGGARAGAVNHMRPEGTFCQSCGMPLHKLEDHGTEANGSQSKKYCAYCYQIGEFREPEMTLDEMIEISAKGWSDQDPDVLLEQARTRMKQILPHLERWRAREIQF